jgi:hypothetical protein
VLLATDDMRSAKEKSDLDDELIVAEVMD